MKLTEQVAGWAKRAGRWWRGLREDEAFRFALAFWAVYAVVIALVVVFDDDIHSVMKIYREAAADWWRGDPLYDPRPRNGFFYLPHAAMAFIPYTWFPERIGEMLWRWTMLAALAWSVWRLAGMFGGARPCWTFLTATVVTAVASFSAVAYGQTNTLLAAFLVLTVVALGRAAWKSGALWLLLALVAKPVGLVPFLLAGACYARRLTVPLLVGVALLAGVSFLHPKQDYEEEQYALFYQTMQVAQNTKKKHRFCDVQGIIQPFGLEVPGRAMNVLRVLAALAVLLLAWRAVRHYDAARGAFVCLLLAVLYLLLFNPRTETNSYVMLAPFVGILVAAAAAGPGFGPRFWWLAALAVTLTAENLGPLHQLTHPWLKPAATVAFAAWFVRDVVRRRDPLGLPAPAPESSGQRIVA
ncbi:MAG: glycosyltransferase family 87 protein [Chthoniobacterales bacterium]